MFLLMTLKRNMRCHKMKILVMLLNHLKFKFDGLIGRGNKSTMYPSDDYVTSTNEGDPECYLEAIESEKKKKWLDVMQDEIKSLYDNHTFDLVKLPKDKKALENRWIYRVKQES